MDSKTKQIFSCESIPVCLSGVVQKIISF